MKIGIDASFLRKPGTGIGQVTTHFLKKLVEFQSASWRTNSKFQKNDLISKIQNHNSKIILYTEEPITFSLPSNFENKFFLPRWWRRDDAIRKILWEKQVAREAIKDGCEVFISLYQSATIFQLSQLSTLNSHFFHRMVVHDIIPRIFPEYLNKWTRKWHWKLIEKGIRNAVHIMAVSESTKKDLMEILHIRAEKITVASPGLSPIFDTLCSEEKLDVVLKKYELKRGYIYHGGGLEVRKNTEKLLRAYKQLTTNSQQDAEIPKLVISGKIHAKNNPLALDVEELIKELGLEENVKLLGFVLDEDLPALYRGAAFFVYPSLYEGLGLPPLEAMSQGTPVIVSNVSSLPEVCGDAALFVDPKNTDEIAEKMRLLLDDADLRFDLREKGSVRAKQFTWDKFVRAVMQ